MLKKEALLLAALTSFISGAATADPWNGDHHGSAPIRTASGVEACYDPNGWSGFGYYRCGFQRKTGEGFLGARYDSLTSRLYGSRFDRSPVVGWDHEAGGGGR